MKMETIKITLNTYVISGMRGDAFPITREFTLLRGTTMKELFNMQFAGRDANDYFIRLNEHPTPSTHVLYNNDIVTIIPKNLKQKNTLTISPASSGTVSITPFDYENEIDPSLLDLEEKIKKLME
ncbi:MAG: hypothetical protein ACFFD2_21585 [Promethearchaeota archaeon]